MVKYSCEKCGKEFTQKGHYTKHINKKNSCISESKIKEIKCNEIKIKFIEFLGSFFFSLIFNGF